MFPFSFTALIHQFQSISTKCNDRVSAQYFQFRMQKHFCFQHVSRNGRNRKRHATTKFTVNYFKYPRLTLSLES